MKEKIVRSRKRKEQVRAKVSDVNSIYKELFPEIREVNLKLEQAGFLEKIYRDGFLEAGLFAGDVKPEEFLANQCCRIVNPDKKYALAVYKKELARFNLVKKEKDFPEKETKPINDEQALAYALLTDPKIELVVLTGKARTGKTLISLLAGYELLGDPYKQLLIYRPNIELGRPLGFLPGEIREKFEPWKVPIFDNLDEIAALKKKVLPNIQPRKRKMCDGDMGRRGMMDIKSGSFNGIMEVMTQGGVEIAPIAYIRGRSLHDKFVIIDDGQNLTDSEIKAILTRPARNVKIVLAGDISQVDHPSLNSRSNGLVSATKAFRGEDLFGEVVFKKCEGTRLAQLAADRL